MSLDEITHIIRTHYGEISEIVKLRSERDQVYRLTLADGVHRVFKLSHPAENDDVINFQTQALLHLSVENPDISVPRLVPARSGALEITINAADAVVRRGRMFTFLPGTTLESHRQTQAQATALGAFAARLDVTLRGYQHPASRHELLWDIQHASRTQALLSHTRSAVDRILCQHTLENFERDVSPKLAALRSQVIHNDLNPHNVLVDPLDSDRLTGIIDFGDMVHAPLINEVAVACAYLLANEATPLGTVPHFVAAYHSYNPLNAAEIALLPQLMAVRHAITIVITNWRAAIHPDNRDYILRNQASAINGINKLCALPQGHAADVLAAACMSRAS